MPPLSRREFVAVSSTFLSAAALAQPGMSPLTAGDVIARIKDHVGIPWREKTVDNLLTGTPETRVRGIATTMMATLEVVKHCVTQGCNMIVTHETPLYLHQDQTDDLRDDATLRYKLDFCRKHEVALFHFHDHWHARHPDGIAAGMNRQLGWERNVSDAAEPKKLVFDGVPLATLARTMATRLNAHTLRVLGDPALPIHRVHSSWGFASREPGIALFSQPDLDLLICGETHEWELVEYCQDAIRSGQRKALIVVGHVLSEQGGMILCADWLRPFVPEVPVRYIATPEPFWNPAHPLHPS